MKPCTLITAETARLLDGEASARWGLHPFALVEAAGRACAGVFYAAFPQVFSPPPGVSFPRIVALSGGGNNGADAMVMLRALILRDLAAPSSSEVLISRIPDPADASPWAAACRSLEKLKVPVRVWNSGAGDILARADLVIDGIAGTGLRGPLTGIALEMVSAVNTPGEQALSRPFTVSVDVPSGNFDGWKAGMPILKAHAALAIEPQKLCLYKPAARPFGGTILPVGGIFPRPLIEEFEGPRLIDWETGLSLAGGVRPEAYKYERGLVEIRAGSPGAAGAAKLAAAGAQAAGAGLVRLIADPSIYPILAAESWGVMVVPDEVIKSAPPGSEGQGAERFSPGAALLGPGWGTGPDRARILSHYLAREERGLPLILDADAISLARDAVFHGNAILTPHPGEFAAYTGISREELLSDPGPVLLRFARERNAVILFKSHVLYIASFDGRLGVIDGMAPCLAAGGTGDVLAGFCAAIAARMGRSEKPFDGYACAVAAASLLIRAGRSPELAGRFADPKEIAGAAASLAGAAWLPKTNPPGGDCHG
ncbi:MAG: bifunctional ADP-dependent NAD(P)H-hydrate dehydratase/NAD(P)H-hydrate epimerase [Treponema sp.]|jgi:NAD(P)H-hydrate epimerase|nr:bifunctional ADP-dependent NAD(P)H-hydrate dehydratase/NAD(P)H-hydrate epimerase [Treponema sp.]